MIIVTVYCTSKTREKNNMLLFILQGYIQKGAHWDAAQSYYQGSPQKF